MARDETKLVEAKFVLYTELLKMDPEEATKEEVKIVLALSQDQDIKRVLKSAIGPKKA